MQWPKSAEAITGLIASIFGGCIFLYKKGLRPAWKIFKNKTDLLEKAGRTVFLEKKLDSLVRLSETALIEFSSDGSCINVNFYTCELFGVSDHHAMYGYGWCNYITELSWKEARSQWSEIVKTDSQLEKVLTIVSPKSGKETIVKLYVEISKDEKNKVIVIIGKFKVLN